jgi:hypothetical protein
MEEVKQKAIELILDIISKEDFEMMLYEKVKTEDLLKNKLLFDFVDINYRKENFKLYLLELLEASIPKEVIIIFKVYLYSTLIKDEDDLNEIYKNFNKIYKLFDFDTEYQLLWDFYEIETRLELIEIKYEKEENVIHNLKLLCRKVCVEFSSLITIDTKIKLLVNGFEKEESFECEKDFQRVKNTNKKWYEFWK